jgi:hypothetical protein
MKKILLILVAVIGFGLSAKAQARITNVTYSGNTITVTVSKNNGYNNCKVEFKVMPTDNTLIIAVGGEYSRTKYGTIEANSSTTTISYSCADKVEGTPQACKVYNFELSDFYVSGDYCPDDKKS